MYVDLPTYHRRSKTYKHLIIVKLVIYCRDKGLLNVFLDHVAAWKVWKKKHHIILCNLYCSSEVQWKGSTSKRWHTLYLAAYTFTCNILPLTSRSPFSLPCSVFRHHTHISLSRLRERVLPGVVCHQCRTSDCAVTAVIFRAGEFRAAQILTPEGQRLNSTVCLPAGVHGGTISGPI